MSCAGLAPAVLAVSEGRARNAPAAAPAASASPAAVPATVVNLPEPAADVVPAGDGRFLLLPMLRLRKVAVVDLAAGLIAHYLSIDSDDFHVAGGKDKAVVELVDKDRLQRWDLASGRLELAAPLPGEAGTLLMGYASDGPLLLGGRMLLSLATLKRMTIPVRHQVQDEQGGVRWDGGFGGFDGPLARVTPDGKVFSSPGGLFLVVGAESADVYGGTSADAVPAEVRDRFPAAASVDGTGRQSGYRVPSMQPDCRLVTYFTSDDPSDRARPGTPAERLSSGTPRRVAHFRGTVYSLTRGSTLCQLPAAPELDDADDEAAAEATTKNHPRNEMVLGKRVLVDVANKRLTTLPVACDRVYIRPLPL